LLKASGEGARLMDLWQGADIVFVFDAVYSRSTTGTIYRLDAMKERIPEDFFSNFDPQPGYRRSG